jgi:hypothetical protein
VTPFVSCAAISVALGAAFMFAAGAPHRYIVINVSALVAGVGASLLLKRFWTQIAAAATLAIGLAMLLTAVFGVHIDGAARWFRVAGMSVQPGLILLPPAIALFARDRSWLASIGLALAGAGLGMQPDRAMAGTLLTGVAVLWLYRREAPVAVALAAALCGFIATVVRADVVPAVLFVEHVVQDAFAFHGLAGIAVLAGLTSMLVPSAAAFARRDHSEVDAVFAATWLTIIFFAIVGNYPTPLVGYGSSAILGYYLSASVLARTWPAR